MPDRQQIIVPHLWFDTQAIEAAEFYASVFPDSSITHTSVLHDTPSGDCDLVSFTLWGQKFEAISAGPLFQFNQSISFIVNFDPLFFGFCDAAKTAAKETQSVIWESLCEGGKVMMPLDSYPFSERYGWVQDRYGVSWQIVPAVMHDMMYTGSPAQMDRMMALALTMKKFDIKTLQQAFDGD